MQNGAFSAGSIMVLSKVLIPTEPQRALQPVKMDLNIYLDSNVHYSMMNNSQCVELKEMYANRGTD
jgi:hypothetical protein